MEFIKTKLKTRGALWVSRAIVATSASDLAYLWAFPRGKGYGKVYKALG